MSDSVVVAPPDTPISWRFSGDRIRMEELLADEGVARGLESGKVLADRNSHRVRLLSGAVMIEPAVLPPLACAVEGIVSRFPNVGDVECFVYSDVEVNAYVTSGRTRTIVAVSSGAVNHLDDEELKFVLGHEVGHALFRHGDLPANHLLATEGLSTALSMRVRAWQRAAELSADRAGLVACGSLAVAARSLFKSASGIVSAAVQVSPEALAGQWQRLLDEVVDEGQRDLWQASHPFPPLRMKALLLFWEALQRGATPAAVAHADAGAERMLAALDPTAARRTLDDPLLACFFFWGGLYVSLADGATTDTVRRRLESIAPDDAARGACRRTQGDSTECLDAVVLGHKSRRRKLSAVELHRIVYGLVDVASDGGALTSAKRARLAELANVLGIRPDACDLIVAQHQQESRNED